MTVILLDIIIPRFVRALINIFLLFLNYTLIFRWSLTIYSFILALSFDHFLRDNFFTSLLLLLDLLLFNFDLVVLDIFALLLLRFFAVREVRIEEVVGVERKKRVILFDTKIEVESQRTKH